MPPTGSTRSTSDSGSSATRARWSARAATKRCSGPARVSRWAEYPAILADDRRDGPVPPDPVDLDVAPADDHVRVDRALVEPGRQPRVGLEVRGAGQRLLEAATPRDVGVRVLV